MTKRYTGPLTVGMLMGHVGSDGLTIAINAYHLRMCNGEAMRRGWIPVEGPLDAWFYEWWGHLIGKTAEDMAGWSPFAEDGP